MKYKIVFKNVKGDTTREFEFDELPVVVPNVGDKIIIKKHVGTVEHRIISYDEDCLCITAR